MHVMVAPPRSHMDILSDAEIDSIVAQSKFTTKYNKVVDSESTHEILTSKLEEAAQKPKIKRLAN